MNTITLVNLGGETKTVEVVDIERGPSAGLAVKWPLAGLYTFDIKADQLVYIRGNRIVKRYPWKAQNLDKVIAVYNSLRAQCPKPIYASLAKTKAPLRPFSNKRQMKLR